MVAMSTLWKFLISLIMLAVARGDNPYRDYNDIIDAVAGEAFIIRKWSLHFASLSISVKKENIALLNAFFNGGDYRSTTDQSAGLVLKYDHTTKEVSLMFQNVRKVDEGLYQFQESFYRTKPLPHQHENEGFERHDGRWNFQFNVHEPNEVKRGHVGGKISMEFTISSGLSYLYHYEQRVALLIEFVCNEWLDTHFYGRLRCTSDAFNKRQKIVIDNVTQGDSGLYSVVTDIGDSWRWFLNITDKPSVAYIRGNVTIGWFYNQQGMNRTLLIIHPKEGVMMMLPPTNIPQVKSNIKQRVIYSGDVSKSYMAFTLLNVEKSDSGVYTIQTIHGNTIPGHKQLIVEATATTTASGPNNNTEHSSSVEYRYSPAITASLSLSVEPSVPQNQRLSSTITTVESRINTAIVNESSAEFNFIPSRTVLLSFTSEPRSAQSQSFLWSVPFYVILVIVGVVGLINLMICCRIWIQLKKINGLQAERRLSLEECETEIYLTPIKVERLTPIPTSEDGGTNYSYATENVQFDSGMQLLHETQSFCMNEYESVDVPGNEDPPQSSHDEKIIYESPETINTPFHDTSGYLTVLDVTETSL